MSQERLQTGRHAPKKSAGAVFESTVMSKLHALLVFARFSARFKQMTAALESCTVGDESAWHHRGDAMEIAVEGNGREYGFRKISPSLRPERKTVITVLANRVTEITRQMLSLFATACNCLSAV
jgi:hypothetical protein